MTDIHEHRERTSHDDNDVDDDDNDDDDDNNDDDDDGDIWRWCTNASPRVGWLRYDALLLVAGLSKSGARDETPPRRH